MNESQTNRSKRTGAQDFIISVAKIRIFSDVDVMVMRKGLGMRMRLRCLWRFELKRLQRGKHVTWRVKGCGFFLCVECYIGLH